MKNCFCSKLLLNVENDNLQRLGAITVTASTSGSFSLAAPIGTEIESDDTTIFFNGRQPSYKIIMERAIGTNINISGAGKLYIYNKYNVTEIISDPNKILLYTNELKCCSSLTKIKCGLKGDVADILNSPLTVLEIAPNSGVICKIEYFENNLLLLNRLSLRTIQLLGALEDFGNLINLTYLDIPNCNINGSVENFVHAQIAAGRTTCDGIAVSWIGSGNNITYNGVVIPSKTNLILSWDAENITLDGVVVPING